MMSEPETQLEIEDVLSSIRRLVSRDTLVMRTAPAPAPHREPIPQRVPQPVVQAEPTDCLVLTPALRIEESVDVAPEEVALEQEPLEVEADVVPQVSDDAELASAETMDLAFAEDFAEENAGTETVVDALIAAAEEDVAPMQADETVPVLDMAEDMPAEELPAAEAAEMADVAAPFLLTPEAVVAEADPAAAAEIVPFVAAAEPRPMTEAEILLAEAEAALAETGLVLDDASNAIDAAGEPEAEPEPPLAAPAMDLGDELSRLESTIAELEAAVAESGLDFEPEADHPFGPAAEDLTEATLETRSEISDQAPAAAFEPCIDHAATRLLEEPAEGEAAAEAAEDALEEMAEDEAYALQEQAAAAQAAMLDPELQEPAWADEAAADADWAEMTAVAQAEEAAEAPAPKMSDDAGLGMDWAEATLNLARRTPPRRLAVSDAEATTQTAGGLRSSYEDLRAELAQDDAEGLFDEELAPALEAALFDEAMLRDMVAQMVREELRGSLGERITQNVRKLVRREIQRALMGQDYE